LRPTTERADVLDLEPLLEAYGMSLIPAVPAAPNLNIFVKLFQAKRTLRLQANRTLWFVDSSQHQYSLILLPLP